MLGVIYELPLIHFFCIIATSKFRLPRQLGSLQGRLPKLDQAVALERHFALKSGLRFF